MSLADQWMVMMDLRKLRKSSTRTFDTTLKLWRQTAHAPDPADVDANRLPGSVST